MKLPKGNDIQHTSALREYRIYTVFYLYVALVSLTRMHHRDVCAQKVFSFCPTLRNSEVQQIENSSCLQVCSVGYATQLLLSEDVGSKSKSSVLLPFACDSWKLPA